MTPKRLGFFTRLLDETAPAERYRLALAQIQHAEACGYDSAWVAQHHFHEFEGGLPAPFVFLAAVAAKTTTIRLGTGIVTLPLELPIRVAEDAAVFDLMSNHRLEMGVGPGGNPSAFPAFGLEAADRHALFNDHLALLRTAWSGGTLPGGDRLYPNSPTIAERIWQASFSVEGARRAGAAGDGLMLSRTQPRPQGTLLSDLQRPMIEAYLNALPPGAQPRIMASRSVFIADSHDEAWRHAETGLARARIRMAQMGRIDPSASIAEMVETFNVHLGTPAEVIASLTADATIADATDIAVQVHSVDPPHPLILRSIELMAEQVAPEIGCAPLPMRRVA